MCIVYKIVLPIISLYFVVQLEIVINKFFVRFIFPTLLVSLKTDCSELQSFRFDRHIIRAEQLSFNARVWGYVMWEFCVWLLHVAERSGHLLKRNAFLYLVAGGWWLADGSFLPYVSTDRGPAILFFFFLLTVCMWFFFLLFCVPRQASISHDMLFYCMTCCVCVFRPRLHHT